MPVPPKPPVRPGASLAAEDPLRRGPRDKDELQTEVQGIEEEVEALKARYEQYFLGIERLEPMRWREELKKKVLRAKSAFTRNAALRFRIQSLHARYLSYERLWLRSAREREEGTYRRDLFKARLHARAQGEAAEAEDAATPDAAAPARTPPPGPAKTPPPAPPTKTPSPAPTPRAGEGPVPEAQLRALYDAYLEAKRRCNEDVSKVSYDTLARSVSKQVPELIAKYKARSVEFRVEVKDGRAVLKAVPKV